MERNADYVADFTAKVRAEGIDVRDMAYSSMLPMWPTSPTPLSWSPRSNT